MRRWLMLLVCGLPACAAGPLQPNAIDPANDACSHCRMIVSDPRVAAQILRPGDEPLMFDDIGCLRDYLASRDVAPDAALFVADHRTGAWVPATEAVYTRSEAFRTPMGGGILAHADHGSRKLDPATEGGEAVSAGEVLGGSAATGARR
jgi:copper chaperone NosL